MKHEEITHTIIGCAMKVHSVLGNGFQEVIYQRALAIEMNKQGLNSSIDKIRGCSPCTSDELLSGI